MKKIVSIYFVPLLLALLFLFVLLNKDILSTIFDPPKSVRVPGKYFEKLGNNPYIENQFLIPDNDSATLFVFGSSELELSTEASSYNFIPKNTNANVQANGSNGNQCFSIYAQLLANENRLKNASVVIVLSPIWFLDRYAKGTTASKFLEFNSEHYVTKIIQNDSIPYRYKAYAYERVYDLFKAHQHSNLGINHLIDAHQLVEPAPDFKFVWSKMFMKYLVYEPVLLLDKLCLYYKMKVVTKNSYIDEQSSYRHISTISSKAINWDSLFYNSRNETAEMATNNSWGINDAYYLKYIHGNTQTIKTVIESENQEYKDLEMLLDLLKEKNVHASFVILPMNPFYYTNLQELTPLIHKMETKIKQTHFTCFNLWETDTSKFDKELLTDIMHLSKYGWYKTNKFIIETYSTGK